MGRSVSNQGLAHLRNLHPPLTLASLLPANSYLRQVLRDMDAAGLSGADDDAGTGVSSGPGAAQVATSLADAFGVRCDGGGAFGESGLSSAVLDESTPHVDPATCGGLAADDDALKPQGACN